MEENFRKKLLIFDGHTDLTSLEVKTWRSVVCSLVGANKVYVDQLNDTADVLKMFIEMCRHYKTTGNNSKRAADRITQLLTKISDFHNEVFGDFVKYTDIDGPFGDLLKSNDNGFDLLKKKATAQLKEHEKLEKTAAKAWKYYMRRVKKNEKLELKLSKTLTAEELSMDKKFFISKRKMELALSRYNICYDNEVRQRDGLAEQSESLKKEFLKEEKGKLDTMFFFINDALVRIEKLAPQGLNDIEDLDFEPEVARTKAMAKAGWEAHLKEHTFPERKGFTQTSKESDGMYDDNDDDDDLSGDEDSEDEDSDDETADASGHFRGRRSHKKVRSLAAPKLNNDDSGMNDVLKEILEDLDTVPAFAKLEVSPRQSRPKDRFNNNSGNKSRRRRRSPEPSPESSKRRSRDSSSESQNQRSRDSSPDCRRHRARNPSPVARKRKPLRTTPEFRKCRSPKSSSESRKQTACDSNTEARKQISYDLSQVSRKHRARNSSPENEKQRAHNSNPDPEKHKAHDSNPEPGIERADDSGLGTMILEDLTPETTSCTPSSRGESLPRRSLRRLDPDESISAPRSKSHSEARRKRRQLVTAGLSSTAQDFEVLVDIEHPPSLGQNKWIESSRGSPTTDYGSAERSLKKREQIDHRSIHENKDYEESHIKSSEHQTDQDDNIYVRSESRRRRKAAKEAKNVSDEKSTAQHDDKPCHDKASASHDKASASHDKVSASNDKVTSSHDEVPASHDQVSASNDKFTALHDEVPASHDKVTASHDDLRDQGSSSPRNHKGSKSVKKEPKRKVEMDNPKVKLPYDDEDNVVWKSNITVYVLEDREKQNSKEISIRAGMKLKQTRFTNPSGMAYGYKKTKLGLRKYGYYPAFLVALKPPVAAEK